MRGRYQNKRSNEEEMPPHNSRQRYAAILSILGKYFIYRGKHC